MNKEDILDHLSKGNVEVTYAVSWNGPDYPSTVASFLWNLWAEPDSVTKVAGEKVYVEHRRDTDGDPDNQHGQPIAVVFRVGDEVFIAESHYDSWGGGEFEEGFEEAVLVDKPTWVAKSRADMLD